MCAACGRFECDRAHIKTKGAGGTMDDFNIMLLCREHHTEQHKLGWRLMAGKYPGVLKALENKGWAFHKEFGRVKLVRMVD